MSALLLFNKPFQVLSQFTDPERPCLSHYLSSQQFPGYYPAGRLDFDSEGLLALTDDGDLQHRITHPKFKFAKTYWVLVEGHVNNQALQQLHKGVLLNDGPTRPAQVKRINPTVWNRNPPVRSRKTVPTEWLEITISEGRNRQVRRMTAAIGHPTLRLIRHRIGPWSLENLTPGQWRHVEVNLPVRKPPQNPSRHRRGR